MDDRLTHSPCSTLCVLASKSCCSQTTLLRSSSPGPLVRTTCRCFRLASERANVFALIPQFTILRNNKERALYDSNLFLRNNTNDKGLKLLGGAVVLGPLCTQYLEDGDITSDIATGVICQR